MSNAANALTRVLGLGSAHEGAHHWRTQRLTALAVLLLGLWLLVSLLALPDLSFAAVRGWAGSLVNASLLVIFVAAAAWHSQLGVQVVVEDYTRGATRIVLLIANAFAHIVLGVLGVVSILRLALGA